MNSISTNIRAKLAKNGGKNSKYSRSFFKMCNKSNFSTKMCYFSPNTFAGNVTLHLPWPEYEYTPVAHCYVRVSSQLTILDSYGCKITKNCTPLVYFGWLFYNQSVFKKFERTFFDQVAIDEKNVLTFEKRPLVTELKLKMSQIEQFSMFSISVLPPESAFQMSIDLYHL